MQPHARNYMLNLSFPKEKLGQAISEITVSKASRFSKDHKITITAGKNQKVILSWKDYWKDETPDSRETSSVDNECFTSSYFTGHALLISVSNLFVFKYSVSGN